MIFMNRVAVIGSGSWGTGITALIAPHAENVCLWAREETIARTITDEHRNPVYLKDVELAHNVMATTSMEEAVAGADAIVLASPSAYLRSTVNQLAPNVLPQTPVLVLTKGIETPSHLLMHQVVSEEIGHPERIAVLAGPNHAEEIAIGAVSASVIASDNPEVALFFQNMLAYMPCLFFRHGTANSIFAAIVEVTPSHRAVPPPFCMHPLSSQPRSALPHRWHRDQ